MLYSASSLANQRLAHPRLVTIPMGGGLTGTTTFDGTAVRCPRAAPKRAHATHSMGVTTSTRRRAVHVPPTTNSISTTMVSTAQAASLKPSASTTTCSTFTLVVWAHSNCMTAPAGAQSYGLSPAIRGTNGYRQALMMVDRRYLSTQLVSGSWGFADQDGRLTLPWTISRSTAPHPRLPCGSSMVEPA